MVLTVVRTRASAVRGSDFVTPMGSGQPAPAKCSLNERSATVWTTIVMALWTNRKVSTACANLAQSRLAMPEPKGLSEKVHARKACRFVSPIRCGGNAWGKSSLCLSDATRWMTIATALSMKTSLAHAKQEPYVLATTDLRTPKALEVAKVERKPAMATESGGLASVKCCPPWKRATILMTTATDVLIRPNLPAPMARSARMELALAPQGR